jgi:hypothetical protein
VRTNGREAGRTVGYAAFSYRPNRAAKDGWTEQHLYVTSNMLPKLCKTRLGETYDLGSIRGTPVPNRLLEVVLTLPETQARLLLLIVRQTLGFSAGPCLRRAVVQLSHAQIGSRISRSSTAISAAIDALVVKGFLDVLDQEGRVMAMGAERRLLRAPLTFRVRQSWVEEDVDKNVDTIREMV